jgi:hypothetical protein
MVASFRSALIPSVSFCLLLLICVSAHAGAVASIQVGSIADSRFNTSWTLDGSEMANTRAKLLNPANFGAAGTVASPIVITDTGAAVGSVTPELLSSFHIFFIGWLTDSSPNAFTPAELTALQSYAASGGTLIVTCDDTAHDAVCASLGFPVSGSSTPPFTPTAAGAASAVFNGPFGSVASVNASGNFGFYGTTTGATVIAQDSEAAPRATMLLQSIGSGRIIYLADVDLVANAASAGATITTANDRMLGNLFAMAGAPGGIVRIPTMNGLILTLLAAGLAMAGAMLVRTS